MDKLSEARAAINAIDQQMAELFVRRMRAVEEVGAYKQAHGLPVLDSTREKEVIARNARLVDDPALRSYYINFLENNMLLSRRYQSRLLKGARVAYSGVEGAFAFIAAKKIFPDATLESFGDFRSAYQAVESGSCDCAVLPIENSYAGEVSQVSDLLFRGSLFVNGLYDLEIMQNLMGTAEATLDSITTVISHPQALSQCAEYIRAHAFEEIKANNTAIAAQMVAEKNDPHVAAIASEETAALYGLKLLGRNINESSSNTTRFAVLSRTEDRAPRADEDRRSILLFTVRNEAGSLAKAINVIGSYGFNMETLRSRPMKDLPWQYYFFVELDGDAYSDAGQQMQQALSGCCDQLKIAGVCAQEHRLK